MKKSKYNIIVEKNNILFLYNSFTKNIIRFSSKEDIASVKAILLEEKFSKDRLLVGCLRKYGFIVDDKVNEYKIAHDEIKNYYDNLNSLEIFLFVTNQCNFRCIYCPQEHETKVFSAESWDALYKYMFNFVDKKPCNRISISFFGGEPLLERKAIVAFMKRLLMLRYLNPMFSVAHMITTNAYLLTPEVYDELVSLGVRTFQITIDGMEENHNKTRHLANGKGTWKKIIKHIEYINSKDDNTFIFLRSNVNEENYKDFNRFYEWFFKKFTNKKFHIAIQPITEFNSNVPKNLIWDKDTDDYREFLQNINSNYKNTVENTNNPLINFVGKACPSTNPNKFTIQTDGKVYKCEALDYKQAQPVGFLDKSGKIIFNESIKIYENYETKECKSCVMYPICAGRRCPMQWAKNQKDRLDCMVKNNECETLLYDNIDHCPSVDIQDLLKEYKGKEKSKKSSKKTKTVKAAASGKKAADKKAVTKQVKDKKSKTAKKK